MTPTEAPDAGEAADIDPAIAEILANLWMAAHELPPVPWSLARLAKRTALAMSTLRRDLTRLEEAGLAHVFVDDKARDCAFLTEQGLALCAEAFGEPQRAAEGERGDTSRPTSASAPSMPGDHG